MTRIALRFPYLTIVVRLMGCLIGGTTLVQPPVDLFPAINIPVVAVATFYYVITALASASMIATSYFVDPVSGNDYILTVQYPENRIRDLNDVMAIPIRGPKQSHPARLDSICSLRNSAAPTEVDHYQIRRVMDVYVAPTGENLGQVVKGIRRILAGTQTPLGVRITLRGVVQGMESSFRSFGLGLILSVVLV